jgi:hypothetical protein
VDTGLDFNHQDLNLEPEVQGVNAFNAFGGSCQDSHGHGNATSRALLRHATTRSTLWAWPRMRTLYCVSVFEDDPVQGPVGTDESTIAGLDWIAATRKSPDNRESEL